MQHILILVFGWMMAIVAVTGLVAGAPAAAKIAGNSMSTVGVTVGAIIGGADDLMGGFNAARTATGTSSYTEPTRRDRGGVEATRDGR